MNSLFLILYLLLWLACLAWDQLAAKPAMKKRPYPFYVIYSLSLILYLFVLLGVRVPMPSDYFSSTLAPWLMSWMK
ncbi:hypothetical protein [Marinicrinis sediminis]|uniref:Uncharacterized protein n=1 Tax=Marinicrinis sediminis TaxID=1652465 RepID=A0ABW5R6Z7_9BACL